MTSLAPVENNINTIVINGLTSPVARGAFGQVYRVTIKTSKGQAEVAVKVFEVDHQSATSIKKMSKSMHRELKVWLRLKHSTIVPLLGIAHINSLLPALVSQWMPCGTLTTYLTEAIRSPSIKRRLVKGVADGLNYRFYHVLHFVLDVHPVRSMNVVHGDLHPGNVLINDSGNPCLTDFGLATVEGEAELQLNLTTAEHSFNSRWRAPEVLGLKDDPERPTFMSDIYSFGGVMFFIISGDIPWKEKKQSHQICVALSNKAMHARPNSMPDNYWNLVRKCWSWEPGHRPSAANVLQYIDQFRSDNLQDRQPLPSQRLADDMVQSRMDKNTVIAAQRRTVTMAAHSDTVYNDHCTSSQQDAGGDMIVPERITQSRDHDSQASTSELLPLSGVVVEQAKISIAPSVQSSSRTLVPSRNTAPFSPLTQHVFSTIPSLVKSHVGPLNVLLFGEAGVGKSSIINLIMGCDVAQTSPDAETCTLKHTSHEVTLGNRHFKLWEVSSIKSKDIFQTTFMKWRPKEAFKKLYDDDGICLILYCMRGSRGQGTLIRHYRFFTDIIGTTATVPVAAVVTCLEDYPKDMDVWWAKNKDKLESLGMRFTAHACITSLPDGQGASPAVRARRQQSEQLIRTLIQKAGSPSPALTA